MFYYIAKKNTIDALSARIQIDTPVARNIKTHTYECAVFWLPGSPVVQKINPGIRAAAGGLQDVANG